MIQAGFVQSEDVSSLTEAEVFAKYKDSLDNGGLVQISNGGFNDQMRDYGIACKYLFLWPKDMNDTSVAKFRAEALCGQKTIRPFTVGFPTTKR